MLLLLAACSAPPEDSGPAPTLSGQAAAFWLDPLVVGDGSVGVGVEDGVVTPTVTGSVDRFALHGAWSLDGVGEPELWRQGWQSWSWSGVQTLDDLTFDGDFPAVGGDGDGYSVADEVAGTSWSAVAVGDDSAAFVLGATSAETAKVWFAVDDDELWIVWDGPLPEGALDPVRLYDGADAATLWTRYADSVPGRVAGTPPTGWSDWYVWYGTATEDDLRANLPLAASLGLDVFQVDDGWEVAWGDWTYNAAFSDALVGDVAAAGLRPGLWMAPLLVDRSTSTWLDHPDWWVRDATGAELDDTTCDCATLDVTVPDAAAWLQATLAAKVAEGWTYLKLDFLYAGAREGVRAEPLDGAQAYRRATELMREAVGEDTWILACGAPMLPSVGFADSWRSGSDIAFSVFPDPDPAFLRWEVRSTAARSWANGRWWWNDADALLVRDDFSAATAAIAGQAVSGGVWFLGDELADLDPRALSATELRGTEFVPQLPFGFPGGVDGSPLLEKAQPDDRVPTTWVAADGTTVLLNVGDDSVTVQGPGGTERLSGATAEPGPRTLAPGVGEIWE